MQAPNAPRRNNRCPECGERPRRKPQTLWTFLRDSGLVRQKYLRYNPKDVEEIEDLDVLEWLYGKYHLPASQPQTIEEATYLALMSSRTVERLNYLRASARLHSLRE